MGTDPGIAMQPSVVDDYKPQPPAAPTNTAQQFKSGLAGGQELSMADIDATDRVHTFILEADQVVRSHVDAADKSKTKYAQTEAASRLTFMNVEQLAVARFGAVDTEVHQLGPIAPPTAFMGPAPEGGN